MSRSPDSLETIKAQTESSLENKPAPKATPVQECPYKKAQATPEVAELVKLPAGEQAEILLGLYKGTYGGVTKPAVKGIVQAVAEWELKKQAAEAKEERPIQTEKHDRPIRGSDGVVIATDSYQDVTAVRSAIRSLWDQPDADGRTILDEMMKSERGSAAGLKTIKRSLVKKGYKDQKDLRIPAKAADLKDFMKWVIRAVFEVETQDRYYTTSWEEKHLRDMWAAFCTPPRDQFLKYIYKMRRLRTDPSSSYEGDKRKIKMSNWVFGTTYGQEYSVRWLMSMGQKKSGVRAYLMDEGAYTAGALTKNAFVGTALHEIGHAVDAKFGIMANAQVQNVAGWISMATPENVAFELVKCVDALNDDGYKRERDKLDEHHKAAKAWHDANEELKRAKTAYESDVKKKKQNSEWFVDVNDWNLARAKHAESETKWNEKKTGYSGVLPDSKNELDRVAALKAALPGDSFKAKNDGLTADEIKKAILNVLAKQPIAQPDTGKKEKLERHPAVKMAKENCVTVGHWDRPRAELNALAAPLGGRTFHQAYAGRWESFLAAAKTDGVTEYQFRAPGEWFADLYAWYFMGLLERHPLKLWMDQLKTLRAPGDPIPVPPPRR
jgi:hypothetical protein